MTIRSFDLLQPRSLAEASELLVKHGYDEAYGARPLKRSIQKYIEDPLSEALIQGTITTRPAFIEVFLEDNKLYYRPVDAEKAEGVLLYES